MKLSPGGPFACPALPAGLPYLHSQVFQHFFTRHVEDFVEERDKNNQPSLAVVTVLSKSLILVNKMEWKICCMFLLSVFVCGRSKKLHTLAVAKLLIKI